MPVKKGDRVGAILGSDGIKTVRFLGWGTYMGEELPEEAVGFWAECCVAEGRKSPQIVLDSGEIVYGCECWWSTAKDIQSRLDAFELIENVSITEVRKEYLEAKKKGDGE